MQALGQWRLQVGLQELALPAAAVLKGEVHPVPVVRACRADKDRQIEGESAPSPVIESRTMSKCLVALLMLFISAIPLVAADNQKPSSQDAKQYEDQGNTTQQERHKSADESPGWQKLATWPDGITAWAVILTLIVLAFQTYYTRKSVEAAQNSIALQFRPKLSIRAIKLDVSGALKSKDVPAIWRLVLANVGGSIAHVRPTTIIFDAIVQDGDQQTIEPLGTEQIEAFSLSPGEIKIISSEVTNARDHLRVGKLFGNDPDVGQYVWVRCTGAFVFTDESQIERRIGFRRRFDTKTGVLDPDPDPEYEFDDET